MHFMSTFKFDDLFQRTLFQYFAQCTRFDRLLVNDTHLIHVFMSNISCRYKNVFAKKKKITVKTSCIYCQHFARNLTACEHKLQIQESFCEKKNDNNNYSRDYLYLLPTFRQKFHSLFGICCFNACSCTSPVNSHISVFTLASLFQVFR